MGIVKHVVNLDARVYTGGMDIDSLITYLENTAEESWQTDTVRSKDGKTGCVMSHIFDWGGGDERGPEGYTKGAEAWDWFEEVWATTYMIYKINDGEDERYQQPTPRQRSIAYIKDLRDGKEKTVQQLMREDELAYLNSV